MSWLMFLKLLIIPRSLEISLKKYLKFCRVCDQNGCCIEINKGRESVIQAKYENRLNYGVIDLFSLFLCIVVLTE